MNYLGDISLLDNQVHDFLCSRSTSSNYISVPDNAVRRHISEKIDSAADSIFSYTTVEDVKLVMEMLTSDEDFKKENATRHNSMTAALNPYLNFIKDQKEIR